MIDRMVFVGQPVQVSTGFFESSVPVQSGNPALYPNCTVLDCNNDVVSFGVGAFHIADNLYHASFTVPSNAMISTENQKYSIIWEMKGTNNKLYRNVEYFDCANPDFDKASFREQLRLVVSNAASTFSLPLPDVPATISFSIGDLAGATLFSGATPTPKGSYNEYYIYSVTVPANTLQGGTEALCKWDYIIGGSENSFYQKIYSASMLEISLMAELRLFLDKTLKPIDLSIGYRDSELCSFIRHGLNVMNNFDPPTTWAMTDIIGNKLQTQLVMCAAWWGLDVQFLAEADNVYNYTGQQVSLDVDHTGFIESEKQRLWDYLDGTFKVHKKQLVRRSGANNFVLGISSPNVSGLGMVIRIPMPLIQ